MMALAGYPLGIRCSFLDQSADAPGGSSGADPDRRARGSRAARELASKSDVLTFDWENISGKALAPLEKLTAIRPPRAALEVSQDRLHEKALFTRLKIPVAEHAAVDTRRGPRARRARSSGTPGILKTRRLGYDGKGQCRDRAPRGHRRAHGRSSAAEGLIYEKFQRFSREVSLIAARSVAGDIVHYPLSANSHAGGILRYGVAPVRERERSSAPPGST